MADWSTPEQLSANGGEAEAPSADMDGGTLVAVWQERLQAFGPYMWPTKVQARQATATGWAPIMDIPTTSSDRAAHVAVDRSGNASIALRRWTYDGASADADSIVTLHLE